MENAVVSVVDGNVEGALRRLKKLMMYSGTLTEMRRHEYHVKPSMRKRMKQEKARKRIRKAQQRRAFFYPERD